jgi:hypothetical protein
MAKKKGLTPEQQKWINKAKTNSKGAYKQARHTEPVVRGQLPGGLIGVIAAFQDYKLGEKDGKQSLSITGIVKRPEEHAGARATRMYFLSESEYNTVEDAYAELYGDLQLMGVDTTDADHEDMAQLILDLEELKEEGRLYKLNTWENDKKRVKVFITGLPDEDEIAEIQAAEEGGEEEDNTGEEEPEEEEEAEEEAEEEEGAGEEEAEEEEPWEGPQPGETYDWKLNSRAKKEEVKIKSSNPDKQTCVITRKDKTTKTIKWSELL